MKKILLLLILLQLSFVPVPILLHHNTFAVEREFVQIDKVLTLKYDIDQYLVKLTKEHKVRLSNARRKQIAEVLFIGQYNYDVDYKDICKIIMIETRFKNVISVENDNGTRDYGVCQINEVNIENLYLKSSKILDEYNIDYSNITNKTDISLNIMSCILHIKYLQSKTDNWVVAYNRGLNGSKRVTNKYENEYYMKYHNFLLAGM